MINDFSIVVFSCDNYLDCLKHFPVFLNKFWKTFDEKCYFVLEDKSFYTNDIVNYEIINTGSGMAWSDRVVNALSKINQKYILFLLDDYYFGKDVFTGDIEQIVNTMEKNSLQYYDLRNEPRTKGKKFDGKSCYIKNIRYGMSLQASLWKREFLLSVVSEKNCNAWQVESYFNKMNGLKKDKYISNALVDTRNLLNIQNGIIQGKWNPSALKFFKKKLNYEIEIGTRPLLPKKTIFKMKIISFMYRIIPNRFINGIKKICKKLGMKFVTE